jgi:uncharacterized protein YpmB
MNFVLIILIYILSFCLFFTPKNLPYQESITQYKTYKDNNKTNFEFTDFKINNDKDDYYNSSDFNNNNN